MTKSKSLKDLNLKQQDELDALMKEAFAKSGIREVMQVFDRCQEKNLEYYKYLAATSDRGRVFSSSNTSHELRTEVE